MLFSKKHIIIVAAMVFFAFNAQSCSVTENFNNSDPMASPKSFKEFIKWRWTKDSPPQPEAIELSDQWRDLAAKASHYSVWIGHATYLINNGDLTIITDPIISQRASPVGWAGPKRLIPPSIPLVELPQIDVVVISHNHYDHLDIPSLVALQEFNPDLTILVPQGDKALLERAGLRNVTELRWWQNLRVSETDFTFTPVQHWSARALSGRNNSWWGGWFMKHPTLALYHAGDTGYSKDFVETRERLGVPDFAFIPIGAYSPRWFMKNQHVDPVEAVQIALDLQAPKSFGMHWGTFILTDEPITEPREKLAEVLLEQQLADDFFIAPVPGEIIWLQ